MLFRNLYSHDEPVTGANLIALTESNLVSNASNSDWEKLLYIQRSKGYISFGDYLSCKYYKRWKYGVILPAGTVVYNANRTKDDKLFYNGEELPGTMINNWRELINNALETEQKYDEHFCMLAETPLAETCPNENCSRDRSAQICGAHVVLKKPKDSEPPHNGELVFIIPLCTSCNNYHNKDAIILDREVIALATTWIGTSEYT